MKKLNKRGLTLIELIVAMLIFAIILTAVTAIFVPILRTHTRANETAAASTILDNLSLLMLAEINNATALRPQSSDASDVLVISYDRVNEIAFTSRNGVIEWRNTSLLDSEWAYLLDPAFYGEAILLMEWEISPYGLVVLTLTLSGNGWSIDRNYASRPIGLMDLN